MSRTIALRELLLGIEGWRSLMFGKYLAAFRAAGLNAPDAAHAFWDDIPAALVRSLEKSA